MDPTQLTNITYAEDTLMKRYFAAIGLMGSALLLYSLLAVFPSFLVLLAAIGSSNPIFVLPPLFFCFPVGSEWCVAFLLL